MHTTSPSLPVIAIGGGQSGLAAARSLRDAGLRPLILEAGARPEGSWPRYYDSLRLFSPAGYSAMPDLPFGGDPQRYPGRDEVAAYLERYAEHLEVDIRTGTTVVSVEAVGTEFVVHTASGETFPAAGVVAASGSFSTPVLPSFPGQAAFGGRVLHSAHYRRPTDFAGERVAVVGGGNSGVQIAYELAQEAEVLLVTTAPPAFLPQRIGGRDLHYWLDLSGFDRLPAAWLARVVSGPLVLDTGDYRQAVTSGRLRRTPRFDRFESDSLVWTDGTSHDVDSVIFATGYRPSLAYLDALGALDQHGYPQHQEGISTTHPGLVYVGLELQRSFSSNTLRGVHRDADHVVAALAAHARRAPAMIGL